MARCTKGPRWKEVTLILEDAEGFLLMQLLDKEIDRLERTDPEEEFWVVKGSLEGICDTLKI